MDSPSVGMLVTPTIRLVRQIGAGGMATVWVADQLTLKVQVVVKFMSTLLASDPHFVERFSREAAAAAQVKSPHVVQVFDHGVTEGGTPFIVMELLEGEDLNARIARRGTLPLPEVVEIVRQVALALGRAHAQGIVHRDVKPGNIFLCQHGDDTFVKVLDFGVAKGIDPGQGHAATQTGDLMGTPAYASPEQLVGAKRVDHRSDLWALALVAFRALTGRRAFKGETPGALALELNRGQLPLPREARPELPEAVDRWFERACRLDPNERFQSAGELAEALRAAAEGRAPPPAPVASEGTPGGAVIAEQSSAVTTPGADAARLVELEPPTVAPSTLASSVEWRPPRSLRSVWVAALALTAAGLVVAALALRTRPNPGRAASPTSTATSTSTPTATPTANPAPTTVATVTTTATATPTANTATNTATNTAAPPTATSRAARAPAAMPPVPSSSSSSHRGKLPSAPGRKVSPSATVSSKPYDGVF